MKASLISIKTSHSSSKFNLKQVSLNKIMRSLLSWLDHYQSAELQVWQATDRQGNCTWSAYDPATKRSIDSLSEAEMRIWIEQRNR